MRELEKKQRALLKQADGFDERTKEIAKVIDQVKAGRHTFKLDFFVLFVGILINNDFCISDY